MAEKRMKNPVAKVSYLNRAQTFTDRKKAAKIQSNRKQKHKGVQHDARQA